jgi:hypothetical protein
MTAQNVSALAPVSIGPWTAGAGTLRPASAKSHSQRKE